VDGSDGPSPFVVAVDGPGGSGKSTVARTVAIRLKLGYLDTGAMYRALTWAALAAGVAVDDPVGLEELAHACVIELSTDPREGAVRVNGRDVTVAIRGSEVTSAVSAVSAVPAVRCVLVALQQDFIRRAERGIVVEGRDIGTVVAPEAPVKVFLTASVDVRATRRAAESGSGSGLPAFRAARDSLQRRDALDSSRPADPLRRAEDAWELDSTDLTLDEVVELVLARCIHAGLTVPA
jgi:cytidylate kinase